MSMPFMWPKHGMPYDYQRYTNLGLRLLLEKNGFEVIEQRCQLVGFRALGQLTIAYIYDSLLIPLLPKILRHILTPLICTPISIASMILGLLTPKVSDTYINNLVLVKNTKIPQ